MIEEIQSAEIKRVNFFNVFFQENERRSKEKGATAPAKKMPGEVVGGAHVRHVRCMFEELRLALWRKQVRRCIIQGAGWETDVGTPRGRRTNHPPNMSCMYRKVPHVQSTEGQSGWGL